MKLSEVLKVIGNGTNVRLATEDGQQWISVTKANDLRINTPRDFKLREVTNMYMSEGRESNENCIALLPALCIIIEGNENGNY